jgi:radical SAM superfamily enzyme YgiQ (UPF0313 family)
MRVTLVDNLVFPGNRDLRLLDVHPHLGLLSLAAVGTAHGHRVSIYDPKRRIRSGGLPYDETLYERVAEELLLDAPDAIGFTTLGCSFLFVLGVGQALERRAADLPLLLGGPHATMLARPILERYTPFDVVVRHEAENTFPAVLTGLERRALHDVPGVSWRTPGGVEETPGSPRIDDLDLLPQLDYELYPMRELDLGLIRIEAGRGCPFACTFCSTATFFQRRYRLKSPARLVAEMDAVHDRYAPREFKLDHDLFTVNRRKVRDFCEEVHGRGHQWRVSARVDCVDEELLEAMAAAGCIGMYFGIETGSPRMQKIAAKRLDLDRVGPILDTCERLGIETTASFITGYPEETQDDQDATLDMLGACFSRPSRACIPQLHILTPEPGTPLFDRLGPSLQFDGHATPFNSWLLRPEDRKEVRREPEIFSTYHYYPTSLERRIHISAVEAVDLLRRLGHKILDALVRRHEGRMASLVRALIESCAPPAQFPGPVELERFVRDTLGDADPLTTAVRYALFVNQPTLLPLARGGPIPADARPRVVYRLPADTRILHDVHDIRDVTAWLDHGRVDAGAFRRASYVHRPGQPHPLRVDPDLVPLLHLFGAGRSADTVAELLGDDHAAALERWLPDLAGAGLLVAIADEPRSSEG